MGLADGNLLDRWRLGRAAATPLSVTELTHYMHQTAEALDFIHGEGFIHGGVNPEDILLVNGEVKVADPGPPVSWIEPHAQISTANLSKAICMAPERRNGINHFQSDQYSLAATYVWLRAGQPSFGLDAQPAAIRSITGCSEPASKVLMRALALEPDARFADCVQFVDALATADSEGPGAGVGVTLDRPAAQAEGGWRNIT
jgi:serine/threonine-protein kinase